MHGTETQKKTSGQFNNCRPNVKTCSGYNTKLTTPFHLCSSRINAPYMSSQQVLKNRNNSESTLSKQIFPVARQSAISWMYIDHLLLISLAWNTANSLCATEMSGVGCKPATVVLRSEVLKCTRSSTYKAEYLQ